MQWVVVVYAWLCESLTDAGGHRWTALLVALGAAVAGDASNAVLAGALACGLVARLACCAHRVAVTSWGGGRGQVWMAEGGLWNKKEEREKINVNLLNFKRLFPRIWRLYGIGLNLGLNRYRVKDIHQYWMFRSGLQGLQDFPEHCKEKHALKDRIIQWARRIYMWK